MGISVFPAVAGVTKRTVDFTSSGTWTCPSGVYSADFLVVGAGGGGGAVQDSGTTRQLNGGGGGGGATKLVTLPVTPGNSYTITVGAKGTGAANGSTAPTAGGFSEVVLSGTTLIRCFGGQGGMSRFENTLASPATSATVAGGGGNAVSASLGYAGAGGAGSPIMAAEESTNLYGTPISTVSYGVEGTRGTVGAAASAWTPILNTGKPGINGYGSGGGGGSTNNASLTGAAPYGSGAGGVASAGGTSSNGTNATFAGCGGGGGALHTAAATATGGNGADGLVRISYYG